MESSTSLIAALPRHGVRGAGGRDAYALSMHSGDPALRPGSAPRLTSRAPRTRSLVIWLGVGVPSSGVFLWLAVREADPAAVWDALAGASPGLLLAGVAIVAVVYLLQAERWLHIAGVPQLRRRWFTGAVISGVAVNNVLPGRLGDLLRARWLSVDAGMPGGRAFATVIVDRAFDVVALVVLLFAGLTVAADEAWLRRIVVGVVLVLAAIVAGLVFARAYTRRRHRARRAHRSRVRRIVRDTLEGLAEPLSPARAARLTALSLAAWGTWALCALVVARAVGIELSPLEAVFIAAVVNLGVAIPSSPGFIGTYQWLAVSALGVFAVDREQALAFAILLQATWYVPTTLVGGALVVRRLAVGRRQASPAGGYSSSV